MNTQIDPDFLRDSIDRTAGATGLSRRLIEKDYFCTLLLSYIQSRGPDTLVFKGGTCLSKVYADFYRLSEDLDFVIPMADDAKRSERRNAIGSVKQVLDELPAAMSIFRFTQPLKGYNSSKQYIAWLAYESQVLSQEEPLKFEVGLREPLLLESSRGSVKTLLIDALKAEPVAKPFPLPCMSLQEIYAEKIRAALTRRGAAIRDFYDLDYAARALSLDLASDEMLDLVRRKLAVPGNEKADVSEERLATLDIQREAELKPVLRDDDYAAFDLQRALRLVRQVYEAL